MGNGYLWLLNSNGVPYRVTADNKIEHISDAHWRAEPVTAAGSEVKICQIVGARHAAFALDSSGTVYQFLLSSHLTIRQKVEIYSNQRWYPMIGWSSRTLPTDRASFSNEDGSISVEMSGFHLKSDGWRWEEPWIVDMDVRKHDKEGWEYATNFAGAVWRPENGVSSFVRRRRWKRHMRYTSLEKWAELPRSNEVIMELAAGGFDMLPEQECLLFALSKDGVLLRRVGIHANNPDGDYWHEIEGVMGEDDKEELSKICCSPSLGTLLVLTWDGRLFIRWGITREIPDGLSWSCLPTPGNGPVAFMSMGCQSFWATAIDGKLWMKQLECWQANHKPVSPPTSRFCEVGGGIYGICLNGKDQLVGVSDTGVVHVREGISSAEPAGRAFLRIVERTSFEPQKWAMVSNSGTDYVSLPKHWISDYVLIDNTSHYRDAKWRKQILNDLTTTNDACWEAFKSMSNDLGDLIDDNVRGDTWNRKVRAKMRLSGERRFIAGMIYLGVQQIMFQPNTGNAVVKSLTEVTSVLREFDHVTSTFTIRASFCAESLEIGFAEESDRDEWHELLEQELLVSYLREAPLNFIFRILALHRHLAFLPLNMSFFSEIRRRILSSGDSSPSPALWSVSSDGLIRYHILSKESFASISYPPSLCIPGCMKSVTAGAEGIVWSMAKDGSVYALSPGYSPISGNVANLALPQKTEISREILEYQRHAFLRGYVTFQGTSNGVSAWMEGSDPVSGLYDKLPSRQWSWLDPEWKVVVMDKSEDGWTYSDVIDGVYKAEKKKKDRVRRRAWQRRCLYTGRGPWITVESPPVCCVEVQKTNADRILVWAVTVNGQVLLRQGVTPAHPQGATWKHIISDYNITAISVASPTCVWATTKEGRLLRRECADQTDMECVDWSEVVYSPMKSMFSFCASGNFVFLLPDCDPGLIVVDVKREVSKVCVSLPKAVCVAVDSEDNLYYCDGSCVVRLERTSLLEFYISGNISIKGCTKFSFI